MMKMMAAPAMAPDNSQGGCWSAKGDGCQGWGKNRLQTLRVCRGAWTFRPFSAMTRWRLMIQLPAESSPVELTWNISGVNSVKELVLQLLKNDISDGYPVNLKSASSWTVDESSLYEIAYAQPTAVTCVLHPGWNLLGVPVMSSLPVQDCFPKVWDASFRLGPVWFWQDGTYQCLAEDGPLNPERGYRLYSPTGGSVPPIGGLQAAGLIWLKSGWNLISPVTSAVIPENSPFAGWIWGWDGSKYFLQPIGRRVGHIGSIRNRKVCRISPSPASQRHKRFKTFGRNPGVGAQFHNPRWPSTRMP